MRKLLFVLLLLFGAVGVQAQAYLPLYGFSTTSGTNTYTATVTPTPSYQNGLTVKIKFANANTGAATINLNSLGAKSITKGDGSALVSGDITAGQVMVLIYDGAKFQIAGDGGGAGAAGGYWDLSNGGALTGNNLIDGDGLYSIQFTNPTSFDVTATSSISANSLNTDIDASVTLNLGATDAPTISLGNSAAETTIFGTLLTSGDAFQIGGTIPGFLGAQYAADYSANFTARSLPDVAYVQSLTGATGAWKLASGGTLTGNNTITMGANTITFTGNRVSFTPNATAAGLNIGSVASDPSSLTTADIWHNSTTGQIKYRQSTSSFVLQASLGSLTATRIPYTVSSAGVPVLTDAAGFTYDSFNGILIFGVTGVLRSGGAVTALRAYYNSTSNGYIDITSNAATLEIANAAAAASWRKSLLVTPGAHTALTAATEFVANDFAGATQAWADGTTTNQRFTYFRGFTVNKTTTSAIFTNIYTMYVDASTAGTGVTFTNNWAAGFAGNVSIAVASNGKLNLSTGLQAITNNSNAINTDAALYISRATASQDILIGYAGATQNVYLNSGGMLLLGSNSSNARFYFVQPAQSSGWVPTFRVDPGAHTSLTAATAFPNNVFSSATQTWVAAAGTIATQKDTEFRAITHSAATSGIITNLYNVYMEAPLVSGSMVATNSWALGLGGGIKTNGGQILLGNSSSDVVTASTRLDVRGIGTTTALGLRIADSGNTNHFSVADNGAIVHYTTLNLTGTTQNVYFSNSGNNQTSVTTSGALVRIDPDNRTTTGSTRYAGLLVTPYYYHGNTGELSGIDVAGSTDATFLASYNAYRISNTVSSSSGTGTIQMVKNAPTYNFTGTHASDVYGYNYAPTETSMTGVANHVAIKTTSGGQVWNGKTTPSQITSNQNDYNPTGLHSNYHIRLSSDASRDITGIVKGLDGEMLVLHNVGAFSITLKDESASSTAANRFALNADVVIAADQSVSIWYDSTSSRWRVIN